MKVLVPVKRVVDYNVKIRVRADEAYSVVPGSSPNDGSAAFEVCAPS